MTGRTHDVIAFTSLVAIFAYSNPPPHLSLATLIVAVGANQIGSLFPDIDQPTSHLWKHVPVGSVVGRILSPLLGGHRFISHSLLGVIIVGMLLMPLLNIIHNVLLVNMDVVWFAFMNGYICHLIADTFTHDGVPWLFPLPIRFGIPPFKFMRIKSGGKIEKLIIFPAFVLLTGYIFYLKYEFFLKYIHEYVKR
ncbi:MAG: metal-dependent hydrolase [Patescibacteria group bacterium]